MVEGSVLFASLIRPVLLFPAGFAVDLAAIERIADSFARPAILFLFAIIRHHGGLCDKDASLPEVIKASNVAPIQTAYVSALWRDQCWWACPKMLASADNPLGAIPGFDRPKGDFQTVRDVSVIFPAFNEEGNIRCTVETVIRVLSKVAMKWEIIVVDDGSSDATALVCDEWKAQFPEVEVIRHGQNRGYGAALKSEIMSAKYDLIFFSDSDGQFDFRDLEQLIFWSEDYDIVAGYRAMRQDPLYRRINALGWNVLVRLVLGIKIRDIDRAFKVFRRSVFDHVQIRCVGAMVNTEILAQATQLGMRIREVKVSYFPRSQGKQSGANVHVIIKAFRELCRPWRKLRQVAPDQGDSIPPLRTLRPQLIYQCLSKMNSTRPGPTPTCSSLSVSAFMRVHCQTAE
jgi:hypothetical protein